MDIVKESMNPTIGGPHVGYRKVIHLVKLSVISHNPIMLPIQQIPQSTLNTGSAKNQLPKLGISRRTVLSGLVATALAVGVGAIALVESHILKLPFSAQDFITTPALPVGTTLYTYYGHQKGIRALAWSPDGKHIASGSNLAIGRG